MKIVIMSDTHHHFSTLQDKENVKMLKNVAKQSPDVVIHCGDEGSHSPGCIDDFWKLYRETPGLETVPTFIQMSNHGMWWGMDESAVDNTRDMLSHVASIWDKYNIIHLDGLSKEVSKGIHILSFDTWYQDNNVPTNDWRMTPGLSGVKRLEEWVYLQKRSLDGFNSVKSIASDIKKTDPSAKTILFCHMGFLSSEKEGDWKNVARGNVYFGAPTSYEYGLDDIDYLYTGHAHKAYESVAINGKTRCASPGSDYEKPLYLTLEL